MNCFKWGDTVRDEEIHIGDVLRIRQWDDMVGEFGLSKFSDDFILVTRKDSGVITGFTKEMRYLCGKEFTVRERLDTNSGFLYRSFNNIEKAFYAPLEYWTITAEMLEPFEEDALEIATDDEIKALFG